ALHAEVSPAEPGSHCSNRRRSVPELSTMPSPHRAIWQRCASGKSVPLGQSSLSFRLPSSHVSPGSRTPLPQPLPDWQPGSHAAPIAFAAPLPQVSFDLQSFAQVSTAHQPLPMPLQSASALHGLPLGHVPLNVLPSSQSSLKSTTPLPHVWSDLQSFEHLSGMHELPLPGQSVSALHVPPLV